ncbi:mandelate racemase/muconate lactonizing enzyme family protein [Leptospira jelokensis]|uniref:mandelate racemase/muconate lactonizing enzyme family protein n=1 Tax=Leptospira jelokensis TaxID=2484931 RepID=UPI00109157A5|nr:mandelate racemase/muconate lactonizing enzyme family protein [Leptospira jelokensis]TGL99196.1 mandelate racemase/muconate lactonizing enzyme family protein [Leptospira jelokensis]
MIIRDVEVFHVEAGWRPWSFIKVSTDKDIVGWSECTESNGSVFAIEAVVSSVSNYLIGKDPRDINKILSHLRFATRQSSGSVVAKAIGGIENALWDILAKDLNVPVYRLFGNSIREKIPLYWSHCGTSRARASDIVKKPKIASKSDVFTFAKEVLESGFKAIKTNIVLLGDNPVVYMPGFAKTQGYPELNCDSRLLTKIEEWIECLREGLGSEIDIALDLNYNFKPDGLIKIAKRLEKYNLAWLEIDSTNADALSYVKSKINIPITSCENLLGVHEFEPFFSKRAMDNISIDIIWNGFSESKKIADRADLFEMNIAPHNYNGHLSTFISLQLCSVVPNLKIAEIDVDDVPWRDELFTNIPIIENGNYILGNQIGWGTDLNEDSLLKYKWNPK